MKFGLMIPSTPDLREGAARARRAEEAGFDAVGVGDHLVWYTPFYDPFVTLACYALSTESVRLETCVLLLSLRHPVTVAQSAVTIDHLSGGRLTLGVGVGGEGPQEFDAMGVALRDRGRRTSEAIEILRLLWTGERVDYEGRRFELHQAWSSPKPKGQILIGVGGRSEGARRRAALLADRWTPMFVTPERLRDGVAEVEKLAADAGRGAPETGVQLWTCVAEADEAAARLGAILQAVYRLPWEKFQRYCLWGPPAKIALDLASWEEAGARHVNLILAGDFDEQLEAVVPVLQGRTK